MSTEAPQQDTSAARAAILYAVRTEGPLKDTDIAELDVMSELDEAQQAELIAELIEAHELTDTDVGYAVPDVDDDADERPTVTLPPVRDGFGLVVVEAPLEVVTAFANLHPAERATMSTQASGMLRNALVQMGRLRKSRHDTDELVPAPDGVAFLTPEV